MERLGIERLYEFVRWSVGGDMPEMKDCEYKTLEHSDDWEVLSFYGVSSNDDYQVLSEEYGNSLRIRRVSDSFVSDDYYENGSPETNYECHEHFDYPRRQS